MSSEIHVAAEDELDEGERVIVQERGREIAVFNVGGEYHAFANWCPHQSGPACEGVTTGHYEATFDRETLTTEKTWSRDGEILSCPWHAWQFDLLTGECLSREGVALPEYPLVTRDGDIYIQV